MKTKTKKKLKHLITKKKLVKRKTSQRVLRGFFIVVAAVCMGGLSFAIATTKPTVSLAVRTNIRPGTTLVVAPPPAPAPDQVGSASWYAIGLPAPDELTCASRRFGRGTYLQVLNKLNGRNVICLVNDYGPAVWTGRVIDLSRGSFRVLQNLGSGTIPVEVRIVPPPPTTLNLPIPTSLGQFLGYDLCRESHTAVFCDTNRQSSRSLD